MNCRKNYTILLVLNAVRGESLLILQIHALLSHFVPVPQYFISNLNVYTVQNQSLTMRGKRVKFPTNSLNEIIHLKSNYCWSHYFWNLMKKRMNGEQLRLQTVSDLIDTERKYHHDCQVPFHSEREKTDQSNGGQPTRGRPFGSVDSRKHKTFMNLRDYLEDNEDCQFSFQELVGILESCIDGGGRIFPNTAWQ